MNGSQLVELVFFLVKPNVHDGIVALICLLIIFLLTHAYMLWQRGSAKTKKHPISLIYSQALIIATVSCVLVKLI